MSTVTAATSAAATAGDGISTTASRVPTRTLDQQDFLKLLVAQAKSQDPLNPKSDMDYVAQMTQFSMLEGMRGVQSDVTGLRAGQEVNSANALLGRTVEVDAGQHNRVLGIVSAVQIEAGKPKVVVGGKTYDYSSIVEVSPPASQQSVQPSATTAIP